MWAWEPVNVSPDGGGICGGDEISVSAYSSSRSASFVQASAVFGTALYSGSRSSATIDITGYGIRSGYSASRSASFLDIGSGGVSIYDEGLLVKANVRSLNFKGVDTVAKAGTDIAQVDIFSPPPAFSLTSFTVSPNLLEVGQVANDVTLNWAYIGNPSTLTIDQGVGDVLGFNTKFLAGVDIAANTTWTITGHSVDGDFTGSATLTFQPKVFSGRSLSLFLDESGIEGLSGSLKGSRTGVYSFAAVSPPSYLYMCWPQSFGLAGGFVDTSTNFNIAMESPASVSVTNTYGVTMNYYVYRSTNALGGAIDVRVL